MRKREGPEMGPSVDILPLAGLSGCPRSGPVPADPMRSKILIVLSFAAGAAIASLVVFLAMMRWSQRQYQMLWAGSVLDHTRYALKLSPGRTPIGASRLEQRLPSLVKSVHSFGVNDQTRRYFVP